MFYSNYFITSCYLLDQKVDMLSYRLSIYICETTISLTLGTRRGAMALLAPWITGVCDLSPPVNRLPGCNKHGLRPVGDIQLLSDYQFSYFLSLAHETNALKYSKLGYH